MAQRPYSGSLVAGSLSSSSGVIFAAGLLVLIGLTAALAYLAFATQAPDRLAIRNDADLEIVRSYLSENLPSGKWDELRWHSAVYLRHPAEEYLRKIADDSALSAHYKEGPEQIAKFAKERYAELIVENADWIQSRATRLKYRTSGNVYDSFFIITPSNSIQVVGSGDRARQWKYPELLDWKE